MKGLCLFISKKSWSQSSHSMWCLKELIPASFFLHVWHSMCAYSDTCPRWFVWACVTWFCLIYLFHYCCIFLSADGVVNSAFFAFDSSGGSYHSSLLCMLSIWMLYFIFNYSVVFGLDGLRPFILCSIVYLFIYLLFFNL